MHLRHVYVGAARKQEDSKKVEDLRMFKMFIFFHIKILIKKKKKKHLK